MLDWEVPQTGVAVSNPDVYMDGNGDRIWVQVNTYSPQWFFTIKNEGEDDPALVFDAEGYVLGYNSQGTQPIHFGNAVLFYRDYAMLIGEAVAIQPGKHYDPLFDGIKVDN